MVEKSETVPIVFWEMLPKSDPLLDVRSPAKAAELMVALIASSPLTPMVTARLMFSTESRDELNLTVAGDFTIFPEMETAFPDPYLVRSSGMA